MRPLLHASVGLGVIQMHTHENALRMSRLSGQREPQKENRDETIFTHEKEVLSGPILRGRAHHPHTHTPPYSRTSCPFSADYFIYCGGRRDGEDNDEPNDG